MKSLLFIALSISILTLSSISAQDSSLIYSKTSTLNQLKSSKADLDKKIETLESELNALKPVKKWKFGAFGALNFNQAAFVNWAPGGTNSFSISIVGNAFANYKYKKWSWDNSFDAAWGILYSNKKLRKSEDRLELFSKAGFELRKDLNISAMMRFNSYFSATYNYSSQNGIYPLTSYFAAPAYLFLSLGIDYKPTKYFSLYLSPATGKFTFVQPDPNINRVSYGLDSNAVYRAEYGAFLSATLNKDIIKNVNLWTRIDLYNNFTDKDKPNRKNIDVDWQLRLNMKISKFFAASLFTQLIYDQNTAILVNQPDGSTKSVNSKVQFRENLGVGISYKFTSKD